MHLIFKLFIILVFFECSSLAFAASGSCNLTIYSFHFAQTPDGSVIQRDQVLNKSTITVQIPQDSSDDAVYSLSGALGDFKVSALVDVSEQSVSRVSISDQSHSADFLNATLATFTNLTTHQVLVANCVYNQ